MESAASSFSTFTHRRHGHRFFFLGHSATYATSQHSRVHRPPPQGDDCLLPPPLPPGRPSLRARTSVLFVLSLAAALRLGPGSSSAVPPVACYSCLDAQEGQPRESDFGEGNASSLPPPRSLHYRRCNWVSLLTTPRLLLGQRQTSSAAYLYRPLPRRTAPSARRRRRWFFSSCATSRCTSLSALVCM